MKFATGPGLPSVSRSRTLTSVSPSGKFHDRATTMQNWTLDSLGLMNEKSPLRSTVHDDADSMKVSKRQEKSLRAAVICLVSAKLGGSTADDVRTILGPPDRITPMRNIQRDVWEYSMYEDTRAVIVYVQLDSSGRVREVFQVDDPAFMNLGGP